nr:hypothetical protein OG781_16400 [Streptomyces sp. NBC_00830]
MSVELDRGIGVDEDPAGVTADHTTPPDVTLLLDRSPIPVSGGGGI